ncbi:MAG: tetratricopeptide (TPR) repeat protein [Cellvibrionaceae bacterium]|jgi:tetratricopeptide (TPR) repeat protein
MRYLLPTIAFGIVILSACSTLIQTPNEKAKPETSSSVEQAHIAPPSYSSFATESLYSLILAELAAGRRQYDVTLSNYIEEAKNTGDLGVITRAARLSQYFRKHDETLEMSKLWLAQKPNDIEANAMIASAYIEKREPLQALTYAEKILSIISRAQSPEANINVDANKSAAITETIANYSRASGTLTKLTLVESYINLIKRYPNYPAIKVGLSILYESQQDTAAAYQMIVQALAQDSNYLPAVMQEIRLLQASKQNEKAIEKIKARLADQPDNNRLRLLYARMLTQTDINAAYDEFSLLAQQSPQHLDIQFSKALIALELKKTDEAKLILESLLKKNYRADTVNFYLGSVAELKNNDKQALLYYLTVNAGEDYVKAHIRAARIMAKQGNLQQAQNHFQQLREKSPNDRPELYAGEAEVLHQLGQTKLAIGVLSQAINELPDDTNLRYNRSSLYEQTNQLDLMENDLRHALNVEPESASTLNALGYFLTSRTKRHQEAYTLIKKAIGLKPNDPAIMDSMGWVLFNLGRNEEAIKYLRKAFELFPEPEVAAHLGEALWVNGKKQEARVIWNNNLKDNPNDSRIIDTMERLQVSPSS